MTAPFAHTPQSRQYVRDGLRDVKPREAVLEGLLRDVRPHLVDLGEQMLVARIDAALEKAR